MKQTIRLKTFETNSSSYHSLAIIKQSKETKNAREIIPGQDLEITSKVSRRTMSWTSSYQFTARSTFDKAQTLLRFIASEVDNQCDEIVKESEYTNYDEPEYLEDYYDEKGCHHIRTNPKRHDYELRRKLIDERFYEVPLIKAFVNAIKKYIGEDKQVIIPEKRDLDCLYDEGNGLDDLLMIPRYELKNAELLTKKFYEIIFDPDYILQEDCESNE